MTRPSSYVLVDNFSSDRSLTPDLLFIVGFSLLTGLMAQIRIMLPFTTIPLTGQTFAVLLSGAVLGSRRGFLSQALYLAEGAPACRFSRAVQARPVPSGADRWLSVEFSCCGGATGLACGAWRQPVESEISRSAHRV